jgi:hypothetical protein
MNEIINNTQEEKPLRVRDIPFNQKEISIIASSADWMNFIGYISRLFAILNWVVGIIILLISFSPKGNSESTIIGIAYIIINFLPFYMGRWIANSARSFMDVINTSIDDQGFLVEGFNFLQKFFLTLGITIIVLTGIVILGIIFWSFTHTQPQNIF